MEYVILRRKHLSQKLLNLYFKKNIRRCMLHKISYEACVSWVLFSFDN